MDHLDTYYRALTEYRKQTSGNGECDRLRAAIARSGTETELIEITTTVCTIEEDWIEEIEKGLVCVEKAIAEERQFIRSNGEVLPIEKVKRVSKDSVEHLARHSNLITKTTGEKRGLVPDHLYTVERLSDYAVYENRFLYMLLCYLRDFIGQRYQKIVELTTTYEGSATISKTVSSGRRKFCCELKLNEERRNDRFLKEHNSGRGTIARIDRILKAVMHYLSTPLMEQVSKAAMLKPPVTKTNILKMNQNFKGAMTLYEFVSSYQKAGYTAERRTRRVSPFPDETADEFAEAAALLSFLTYEHGLGIEEVLKSSYEEEEQRRREEAGRKLAERLRGLQRRVRESGEGVEEYMLLLEKRNRSLEEDSARLVKAKREIVCLKEEAETLKGTIGELEIELGAQTEEIDRLGRKYDEDTAALRKAAEEQLFGLKRTHLAETEALNAAHAAALEARERACAGEIAALNARHAEETSALNARQAEERAKADARAAELERRLLEDGEAHRRTLAEAERKHGEEVASLRAENGETAVRLGRINEAQKKEIERLEGESRQAAKETTLSAARLNALRKEYGLLTDEDEFTSGAAFDELEHQYKVFRELFKTEWKKAKRKIRKEILSSEDPEPKE